MVEVQELAVVDVHGHPFLDPGAITAEQFTDLTSFGAGRQPQHGGSSRAYLEEGGVAFSEEVRLELLRVKQNTIYFKRMILDLARFFGVEPNLDAVIVARSKELAGGYSEYVARLYGDAGIETLVLDFGYPLPMLDIGRVRGELPVAVVPLFRIEPLIAELLKTDLAWSEFRQRFEETIAEALTERGFAGLKSVIAYRTGLDVSPLSRTPDQGYQALDAIRRGLGGGSMKKLRDHLLCRALELALEYDVPMQIHTGMGDYEVNLPLCRPGYLMDLLRFPAYRGCRVLLVHTGFPYHREAAYMANVLPRVYLDVSEGIPFAGHAASEIFRDVLAMAPINKVCYGSDGYVLPEIFYTSAKLGKQALARTLDCLVAEGMISAPDAQDAAGRILAGNARELYRLG